VSAQNPSEQTHLWETIDNFHTVAPTTSITERAFSILWSLCKNRNLKLWRQIKETGAQIFKRATCLLE